MNQLLNRLNLGAKLWLAPGCTLLLLLTFAIGGYIALRQQQSVITEIVDVRNPTLFFMADLERQVKQVNASTYQLLSWSTASYSADQTTKLAKSIADSLPKIKASTATLIAGKGTNQFETQAQKRIASEIDGYLKLIPQVLDMLDVDQSVATTMMIKTVAPFNALAKDIENLRLAQLASMAETNAQSKRKTAALIVNALIALAIGCALAVLVVWAVRRSILHSVGAISKAAAHLKDGDLTARVPLTSNDEIAAVAQGFNSMADSLDAMIATIREKTVAVQAMLVNIPQGILTLVYGNTIHPEYSAYLEDMFETKDVAGKPVLQLIFSDSNIGSDVLSQIEATLSACIGEDIMNYEFNSHLFITAFDKYFSDDRIKCLELTWSPICDGNDIVEKIMLCVRDVTELKLLAAEAEQQKRELDIIGQILFVSHEKFSEFVVSSSAFIAENEQLILSVDSTGASPPDTALVTQLFRNMHTIKGNARTYGFMHLTNLVHEAEQTYDDLRGRADVMWDQHLLLDQLKAAQVAIEEYTRISEVKLGRKGPGRRGSIEKFLMVEKDDLDFAFHTLTRADTSDAASMVEAIRLVRNSLQLLGTDTLTSILSGVLESMPSLATELEKEPPTIEVIDNGIVLANQISDLVRNVFMHLLRNSIDHGIERSTIRLSKGLPAAGHIKIELKINAESVVLSLRDDGAGLAMNTIRQKAISKGLIHGDSVSSDNEVAQLVFAPGFSTAEAVTEVSGRGVGLDAVKAFVERENGTVALHLDSESRGVHHRTFETVVTLPRKFAFVREG